MQPTILLSAFCPRPEAKLKPTPTSILLKPRMAGTALSWLRPMAMTEDGRNSRSLTFSRSSICNSVCERSTGSRRSCSLVPCHPRTHRVRDRVHGLQRSPAQKAVQQPSGKRIPCSDCVLYRYLQPRMFIDRLRSAKYAAVFTPGHTNQLQVEVPHYAVHSGVHIRRGEPH